MKLRIALFAVFVATSAFAQDASPTPAPAEAAAPAVPAAPPKVYLELDQNDLAAVSQALNELPKRIADPLILKLNGQLQAQMQIKEAKEKADKERKGRK